MEETGCCQDLMERILQENLYAKDANGNTPPATSEEILKSDPAYLFCLNL